MDLNISRTLLSTRTNAFIGTTGLLQLATVVQNTTYNLNYSVRHKSVPEHLLEEFQRPRMQFCSRKARCKMLLKCGRMLPQSNGVVMPLMRGCRVKHAWHHAFRYFEYFLCHTHNQTRMNAFDSHRERHWMGIAGGGGRDDWECPGQRLCSRNTRAQAANGGCRRLFETESPSSPAGTPPPADALPQRDSTRQRQACSEL